MRKTPIEVLHDLATEKLGRGAAVSVDRKCGGFQADAWDPKGIRRATSGLVTTRMIAIRDLRSALGGDLSSLAKIGRPEP